MLISDFVLVPLPLAEVVGRLGRGVADLGDGADAAEGEARPLRVSVGPEFAGHRLAARQVEIVLGDPRARGDGCQMVALRWVDTGLAAAVLPVLDADLELAPVGDGNTQITLYGRYEPPVSPVGRGADRLLLHRLAQSTVRGFLRRLGAAVDSGGAARTAAHRP